jgi:hypothetical protein
MKLKGSDRRLLRCDGFSPNNSNGFKHLTIVMAHCSEFDRIAVASVTSDRGTRSTDSSCLLNPGEHRIIRLQKPSNLPKEPQQALGQSSHPEWGAPRDARGWIDGISPPAISIMRLARSRPFMRWIPDAKVKTVWFRIGDKSKWSMGIKNPVASTHEREATGARVRRRVQPLQGCSRGKYT